MKIYQRFLFAIFYTVVYFVLALEVVGLEGRGTAVFFAPLTTWLFVLISIFLMNGQLNRFRRIFVFVLLGVHYVVTLFSVISTSAHDEGYFSHSWDRVSRAVISAVVWYLMGQIALWLLFYRSQMKEIELQ